MSEITPITVEKCQPQFFLESVCHDKFTHSLDIHLPELQPRLDAIKANQRKKANIFISIQSGIEWREAGRYIAGALDFINATVIESVNEKVLLGYYDRKSHSWCPGQISRVEQDTTLIIPISAIFRHPEGWRLLCQLLRQGQLDLANSDHRADQHLQLSNKINVLLIGYRYDWLQLNDLDDEIADFISQQLSFHNHARFEQSTIVNYYRYLNTLIHDHDLPALTLSGVRRLIRFSSRLVDENDRLSLDSIGLLQILEHAASIARLKDKSEIDAEAISVTLEHKMALQRRAFNDVVELYNKGVIRVDFDGLVTGQANGLTVVETDGLEYGEPSRITASVFYGDGDIIDIERKSELGGNIHAKGVMLLSAYLSQRFAKNSPMHLSASLVFEQSYHEVDGDSATLAELCCLISAMAEIPLRQDVATTGAVDQFGAVLAVGSVNEKIEGFYRIAHTLRPDANFTVIIPESNVSQLNLDDDILTAIELGKLTIYPVNHIEQALPILAAVPQELLDHVEHDVVTALFSSIENRLSQIDQHYDDASLFDKLKHWLKLK